jgi:hypothetical protein
MSSGAAQTRFITGTIPLMLASGLHTVTTVLDVARRNLSHGLSVFAFGLLCLLIGNHDFALAQSIGGLQALTIAVAAAATA